MAFAQIASWRDRFTARLAEAGELEVHERDSLDEAVAHMLVAVYGTVLFIVTVVIGSNFTNNKAGELDQPAASIAVMLGTYILILLTMVLPKLYKAYATVNQVDDEMSGLDR